MCTCHASLITATAMTSQPSSQDSIGPGSQAESTDTCQVCTKSVGVKCTTAIKCAKCSVSCHVSCLVNDFVPAYGSPCKSGLQWLADFLRTESFLLVCIKCRGQSSARGFPDQSSNGNSMDFPGQQLASRIEDLHSKILSIEGMLSRLQRDITKEASASDTVQPPSA